MLIDKKGKKDERIIHSKYADLIQSLNLNSKVKTAPIGCILFFLWYIGQKNEQKHTKTLDSFSSIGTTLFYNTLFPFCSDDSGQIAEKKKKKVLCTVKMKMTE